MKVRKIGEYLAQHDIVYRCPAGLWHNGLPLGNGDMTAIAWREGSEYILGIKKSGVWDARFERRKPLARHKTIVEMVRKRDWKRLNRIYGEENSAYVRDPFPSPKPCGMLKIKGMPPAGKGYRERLSLYTGYIDCRQKSAELACFVHAHQNVLVARCASAKARRISFELCRSTDKNLGKPCFGNDGKHSWVDYTFPDGFRYVMMGLTKEKAWACVAVVTSSEAKDPFAAALGLLENAEREDYDGLLFSHRQWWSDFWDKSFIEIPDKFLENLWYYQLYLLASSSRGKLPATPSPHSWYIADSVPWHGDYHTNANVEMLYWPLLASNHMELAEPFYRHFHEVLPKVKKDTWKTFGTKGAKYAFSHVPTGEEIAGGYWRYEIYVTAWIAQMYWWHYLYTKDRKFLREIGYEVMKEVLSFYEGYIRMDDDGKYSMFPCHVVEQQHNDARMHDAPALWQKNVLIDLALLKYLLAAGETASRLVGRYREDGIKWRMIRKKLNDYPHNNDTFLEYEGAPADLPVHHADMLAPLFPCGEVDTAGPDSGMLRMARNTFDTIIYHTVRGDPHPPFPVPTWNDDLNWCWLAIAAARLKLGDRARAILYDMGILFHMKRNGFFTVGFHSQSPEDREEESLVNANSASGLGMAVNEMLIQSHNGLIRLFPAIPGDWKKCRFVHFRTEGSFLVSSKYSGGNVKYILVEATEGGVCRILNPWGGKPAQIYCHQTRRLEKNRGKGNVISFLAGKGRTYSVRLKGDRHKVPAQLVPRARNGNARREYRGPQYLAQTAQNKQWLVRLGT